MGYDELRRLKSVTGGVYGKTYTYRNIDSTQTTPQVSKILYDLPTDRSYSYTYDSMGNIATYGDTDGTVTYTYDAQNQLTKAVIGSTTYAYTYDTVGNILTGNGHTYTYGDTQGWKDLLTKVDGQSITYDAVGNPLSYYNGTRWTFTWGQGKRLKTATNGTKNLSFTYDADGIRTSKTVDGVKHTYYYAGGKLLRETYGSNTLDFFYDANGTPYALKYNETLYYYITNLQGDVMRIVDGTGTNVAKYRYDPYGNLVSSSGTMAANNPLRYRGYYFDSETGFYYLQSRYYDPKISRFISPDDFPSTGQGILGNNMFAYCGNNPVIRTDVGGDLWDTVFDVVSLCVSFVEVVNNPSDISAWVSLTGDAVDVLVPFVSGVGEATRLFRAAEVAGDIHEAVKTSDRAEDAMELMLDGACFIAGTEVLTEDGTVPIESIRTGDLVWAWDEESGDVALKKVVETYINKTDELIHVFANGEEIITTPTHPFYSPVKGWTDAVHLRAGDILVLVNGEYVVVEKIQHEIPEAPVIVYNFQVEDYHTYYVASGVLVHNSCAQKNTTTLWDIHSHSQGSIKTKYNGTKMHAEFDGNYYWLPDKGGHGDSAYKVFTLSRNKLYWYSDADIYGNFIVDKHKGPIGLILDTGW